MKAPKATSLGSLPHYAPIFIGRHDRSDFVAAGVLGYHAATTATSVKAEST
jgi:hypothetical protein